MNTPHKHAAVIKAWADGAQIQYREAMSDWADVSAPSFAPHVEYRVKPDKPANVVRYCPVYTMPAGSTVLGTGVTDRSHAISSSHRDWTPYTTLQGVLRIEINSGTHQLVSTTMEKP